MTRPPPIYPPALKPGDTIGVIAPSSCFDRKKVQPAIDFFISGGFKVVFHPQTELIHGQMAGTTKDRVAALHDYFKDPNINAIFCLVGGNGAIHLLDQIDYNLVKSNPKIFMGFSDITSLLNAISTQTGLVTFHGPTLSRIGNLDNKWPQQMLDVVTGQADSIDFTNAPDMEGTLYGGNLSVMQTLIGTPYAPNMDDAVLMLEDINDHLSRYDRMVGHMKQAGWLKNLSGILLGEFLKSQDNPERPFGFSIEEIVQDHAPNRATTTDLPFGHGKHLCTLPIGAKVSLKNNKLSFKSLS